jgi:hypothetical protein
MLEGLVGLLLQAEISKAQIEVQDSVDSYYVAKADSATGHVIEVTYDVNSRGEIAGDLEEFRDVVAETLSDSRGWVRANVKFTEVENGGRLHMVLAAPAEVAAASSGCSDKLSCTVKPYVYINDDRWLGGSDSYNELGVTLQNYRRMVINHEVGHFLGHGHVTECETSTGLAPIMLQQSTGLLGCKPNSWPLPNELWVKGI